MPVTADDLEAATASVIDTLRPTTDAQTPADWSAPAGGVEWDCWRIAEHIGDCLLSYAAQLVARPRGRYVRFQAFAEKDASPAEVLEFALTGARILASTVRAEPAQTRAFHPTGMADPEGFAGMGIIEILAHGHDIAQGLGLAADVLDPPREVCARVLARMFPDSAADVAGLDPWTALLWVTGRAELPDRPRVEKRRSRGAPLGED